MREKEDALIKYIRITKETVPTAMPLYYLVYDALDHALSDNVFEPGDKLTSNRRLCELFDVSVITVQRAMKLFFEEGRLISRRGLGTYVSDVKASQRISTDDVSHSNGEPLIKHTLNAQQVKPSREIAREFNLRVSEKLEQSTYMLRSKDGILECYQTSWQRLDGNELNSTVTSKRSVSLQEPSPDIAMHLGQDRKDKFLVVTTRAYEGHGRLQQITRNYYDAKVGEVNLEQIFATE